MLRLGMIAPDFSADTTQGRISFHDWLNDDWCVLFSHPKDFTPVCTTELAAITRLMPEFSRRGVKVIGISVDTVDIHLRWIRDIADVSGSAVSYPLVADIDLSISKRYGMLPEKAGGGRFRTAIDNHTVRSVFVIAPDKTIKLTLTYPMCTGRDFTEILRAIDSLQLTARSKVATPADWKPGDDVVILPAVSDETARLIYPHGWDAPKPYLRMVPHRPDGGHIAH